MKLTLGRTSLAGCILALLVAVSAEAKTITVTSTADAGGTCPGSDCTLRQAIAGAVSGVDTIDFSLPASSTAITLTSGHLLINKNLTISGPGANLLRVQRSTAVGLLQFRIFTVSANVSIAGLTIADGHPPDEGGGIANEGGTLLISNSTISGNTSGTKGGGVYNFAGGTVTLTNSTVSGNTAGTGAGLENGSGTMTITSSTISGNIGGNGAGIHASTSSSTLTITNSTIASNSGGNTGGGISREGGTVNVMNTIIAQNTVRGSGSGPDLFGAFTSQGFNLIGNNSGSTGFSNGVNNDQVGGNPNPNVDPKLGDLKDNGGPTKTHALLSGSPAIEAGHSSGSNTDQRGFARPVVIPNTMPIGDGSDIGAYEVQADLLPGCSNINRVVKNNQDSGADSLRGVIANVCAGSTITFAPSVRGAINLTSDQLLISKSVTIEGPGANLLSVQRSASAGNLRIFNIAPAAVIASISGLTIANGSAPPDGTSSGGIASLGTLTLTNCTVSGNTNDQTNGGGILNSSGTLTIISSTISGNSTTAGFAGGIYNYAGTLTITNSTISGNSATEFSLGLGVGGGILNTNGGTAIITNSTISGNTGQYRGGGIRNTSDSTVRAKNTIIAANTAGNGGGPDVDGAMISDNFNLIGNNSGAMITPAQFSDQIGNPGSPINPMLGALQNNGGPTLTRALLTGSRAIDKGHSSGLTTDQRGYPRTFDDPAQPIATDGDNTDIGAFELFAPFAVSRKLHGAAAFDIALPLTGTAGIECRSGGATNDYRIVATFGSAVSVTGSPQAQVTSGVGTVGSGGVSNGGMVTISGNVVTIPLTNVSNAQKIVITLSRVSDGSHINNVSVPMAVLVGDGDATGRVDGNDVSGVQSHTRQITASNNYRFDVDATGRIDGNDVSATQAHTRTGLPR